MVVGNTTTISRTETQGTAWRATGASVTVTAPDASAASPAVTVSPPTADVTQTLTYLLTPSVGGLYVANGQYTDPNGVVSFRDVRFATWTDAFDILSDRLPVVARQVSGAIFGREFAAVSKRVLVEWPIIGNGLNTLATIGSVGICSRCRMQSSVGSSIFGYTACRCNAIWSGLRTRRCPFGRRTRWRRRPWV